MRAGIEPGKTSAEHLDIEISPLHVDAIDVGDLELAARRGLQLGGDLDDLVIIEIEARDRDV